jgi:hypothetical protein
MSGREIATRIALISLVVGGIAAAAMAMGADAAFLPTPLLFLGWLLALILVIRPFAYWRFGKRIGDWIVVLLIFGPFAILATPILWWEHRDLEPGA